MLPIESPNEDFGTSKYMWVMHFVSTIVIGSMKSDYKRSYIFFDVPKSSFGSHKDEMQIFDAFFND